ncbi:MAG TPA: hypothetical protein VFB42_13850 [Gaiellaceae bacterium]|nr:hypothetical protein [Gaiellaceae bacterium]
MRGSSFFEGVRQVDAEIAGQPARLSAFHCDTAELTAPPSFRRNDRCRRGRAGVTAGPPTLLP